MALVIAVYNQRSLLMKFISALNRQTLVPDIIIVDNASTDGLQNLIGNLRGISTYLRVSENLGSSGGWYIGMRHALTRGYDVIILCDSDPVPLADNLVEAEVRLMDSEEADFVVPLNEIHCLVHLGSPARLSQVNASNFVPGGNFVAVRGRTLECSGLVDPCLFYQGDDTEFSVRVKKCAKLAILKTASYAHPIGTKSVISVRIIYQLRNYFIKESRRKSKFHGFLECSRLLAIFWIRSSLEGGFDLARLCVRGSMSILRSRMGKLLTDDMVLRDVGLSYGPFVRRGRACATFKLELLVHDFGKYEFAKSLRSLLRLRVDTAVVKSWTEVALANLNPQITSIGLLDFDSFSQEVVISGLRSNTRSKSRAMFALLKNAPVYFILWLTLLMGAFFFRDIHPHTGEFSSFK